MKQCAKCTVPIVPGQEKWVRRKNDSKRVILCSDCMASIKSKPKPASPDIPMSDWLRQLDVENEQGSSFESKPASPDISMPDWLGQAVEDEQIGDQSSSFESGPVSSDNSLLEMINEQRPTQSGSSSASDIPEWLSVAIPIGAALLLVTLLLLFIYVENNGAFMLAPLVAAHPFGKWLVWVILIGALVLRLRFSRVMRFPGVNQTEQTSTASTLLFFFTFVMMIIAMIMFILFME